MMNVKYEGNKVYINKNVLIKLKYNIYQLLEEDGNLYILLDIPHGKKLDYDDFHNIYCYSIDGQIKWQIGKRNLGDNVVYTMIRLKNNKLYANDFLGRRYEVSKVTGTVNNNLTITK
ncbi:hypothetical protein NIE88_18125 [Sporolactobacillus shoreicorticis]|uniref:Uncharacterized protein n=1 Tax=Sporolactobacillus shoreicorticis TaxID=1923877 RepID=A0ABW5S3B3_9BACL|nr:hypothetical protein [Sporolactobacillus shoreicorticis]MCO7127665.1 hypothetical protein [Sporolactobacillus shoreicorticis]